MIEIGFNGSMVGNMKAAAAYNGLFKGDPGGTDILMLEFILDIGFIDNDITSEYRTALPGSYICSGNMMMTRQLYTKNLMKKLKPVSGK